ncbi:mask, partial [Symbiodinium sp. CCMP2456]
KLLTVWLLSGARLDAVSLEETGLQNVAELKKHLQQSCGLPPFLQALLHDNALLEDSASLDALADQDLQLALLPLSENNFHRKEVCLGLCEASGRGEVELARMLINARAGVNEWHPWKHRDHCACTTAIHEAAEAGDLEILQLLLEAQGDPALASHRRLKDTPLMIACDQGRSDVVRMLLRYRADANMPWQDHGSRTSALCVASENGHVETARALLESRADVNEGFLGVNGEPRFYTGPTLRKTPLCLACEGGHIEVAAIRHKHLTIVQLLEERGEIDGALDVHFLIVTIHFEARSFEQAIAAAEAAIRLAQDVGSRMAEECAWTCLQEIKQVQEEAQRAAGPHAEVTKLPSAAPTSLPSTAQSSQSSTEPPEPSNRRPREELPELPKLDLTQALDTDLVRGLVVQCVQVLVGFEEDIEPEKPLLDVGLTSQLAVVLRDQLTTMLPGLNPPLPVTLIFDYPSTAAISRLVQQTAQEACRRSAAG